MDGGMVRRSDGWMMEVWVDGGRDGWVDGLMDDGRMDGRMEEWKEGGRDTCMEAGMKRQRGMKG